MKFATVKDGRDYLDNIPLGAIMLSSQINNKILYIYIYIYSAVIYAGFNMHIFWPIAQIIIPNRHKLDCTSSKVVCMANGAALSQLGKSWKC